MGGNAFTAREIQTPRMPPEIYTYLKDKILFILRKHFQYADSPVDAPAKKDHGDVDVHVAQPLDRDKLLRPQDLFLLLGARYHTQTKGSNTMHFALPWPTSSHLHESDDSQSFPSSSCSKLSDQVTRDSASTSIAPSAETIGTDKFVQLDLHILPTYRAYSWILFNHSHGDLWNMVGSTIRKHGLTVNNQAFWVSVAGLREGAPKKLRRVKITDNPSEVLQYLGLEERKYWQQFKTWDDLCDYAASMRFHNPARGAHKEEEDNSAQDLKENSDMVKNTIDLSYLTLDTGSDKASTTADLNKVSLKSNDRRRLGQRPLFNYWISSYLPAHTSDTPGEAAHLSREEVVDDLKNFFGQEFRDRYDEQANRAEREVEGNRVWVEVRQGIRLQGCTDGELTRGMKALRKVVMVEAENGEADLDGEEVTEYQQEVKNVRGMWQRGEWDDVKEWCLKHWREVEQAQKNKA